MVKTKLMIDLKVGMSQREKARFAKMALIAKRLSRYWGGIAEAMRDLSRTG